MPHLAQFVLVTAVFAATAITCIVFIARRGVAAARIAAAARLSVARVDRIVHEAQDMLVPIGEVVPMSAHGLHRPPLVLLTGRLRTSSTALEAADRPSKITDTSRPALRSIRRFDDADSPPREPGAPFLRTDLERGDS